jgi:hypothetical protein
MTSLVAVAGSTSGFTQSLSNRASASNAAGSAATSDASATKSTSGNPSAATVVSLSRGAIAFLLGNATPQKDFSAVTRDARAKLDANYADLASKGTPFDYRTMSSYDPPFEGLDRRSLYAIASNSGRLFSEDEQLYAQGIMIRQQGAAIDAADPLGTNHPAHFRASIEFLNGVSAEEKTSVDWAVQQAAGLYGYEESSKPEGEPPPQVDGASPLVKMILSAMRALTNQAPHAISTGAPVKDLKDMPLFKGGVPA